MSTSTRQPRPITGRFVLIVTSAFFAVVIGVNVLMMQLAMRTLPGTDVDSAYKASLAYQTEIDAARAQAERAWKVDAHVERRPDGSAAVRVEAHDGKGQPLAGVAFTGRLERPADKRADRELTLAEAGGGVYRGALAELAPGQWDLVLEADAAGRRVFLSKNRVILN
jgi:nitrogen fixation protein FixH